MDVGKKIETMNGIAIIGMAGRFPGARNVEQLWDNLINGIESVTAFKEPEEGRIHTACLLENAAAFDAAFFGMTPREAELTDPQHRLFLECAYEAMEASGYAPTRCPERVGVYAGSGQSDYVRHVQSHSDIMQTVGTFQVAIGNGPDFLTTRVSHKLKLNGPSIAVQTACSSSLVAVHMACQALFTYECDMALAGGVSVKADQMLGFDYQEGGILAPDGHCRAFDAASQGTVVGNGVGVVALKRLDDAIADGDEIVAIIRGTAVNNDGADKVGYTAPSVARQAEVVKEALTIAGVDPATITYIEAHGTGTALGDPIEIAALTDAYRTFTRKKQYCAVGSVKTNIGHLDSAAGVSGLIKAVLCIKHRMLPPSLHYKEPNPHINFADSPFYVNGNLKDWLSDGEPLRAGVSSFGIGGTNAHVILEEAPPRTTDEKDVDAEPDWHLLALSARTPGSLRQRAEDLIDYLQRHQEVDMASIAYTLAVGKESFARRMAIVAHKSAESAMEELRKMTASMPSNMDEANEATPSVFFMFTGQGAQYVHMASDLYRCAPAFRKHIQQCAKLSASVLDADLLRLLYPLPGEEKEAANQLHQTKYAQPALFCVEYALAKQMEAWGIKQEAMIGHSIGEYVAACLAGVMSLNDAIKVIAVRASLMQQMERGAMTAVSLSEADTIEALGESGAELSIAVVNSPRSCVVAGTYAATERFEAFLSGKGVISKRLATSHAYHSEMMEPILPRFAEAMRTIRLHPPNISYISNVTGRWITPEEATDPQYWVDHLRKCVRFADGIKLLLDAREHSIFVEIGPGHTLSAMVKQQIGGDYEKKSAIFMLPAEANEQSAYASVLRAIGELWCSGVNVDPASVAPLHARRRVCLPTYPFERHIYYLPLKEHETRASYQEAGAESNPDSGEWFYAPMWKQTALPFQTTALEMSKAETEHSGSMVGSAGLEEAEMHEQPEKKEMQEKPLYLLLSDNCGVSETLKEELERFGNTVILAHSGDLNDSMNDSRLVYNPAQSDSYERLIGNIAAYHRRLPNKVIHLGNLDADLSNNHSDRYQSYENIQQQGLFSVVSLAQAIGLQHVFQDVELIVLTGNLLQIAHERVANPERATLVGALRVIPQEYARIGTRLIDVDVADFSEAVTFSRRYVRQLAIEISSSSLEFLVAYRGFHRYVQTIEGVRLPLSEQQTISIRDGGVYFITGADGGIGLLMAEAIAKAVKAKLILIGESPLPDISEWDRYLSSDDTTETTKHIRSIRALEQNGSEVWYASASLADEVELKQIIVEAEERFGSIHGMLIASEPYDSGLIQLKDIQETTQRIVPYLVGLSVLAPSLNNPDAFLVLFSRTVAITGGAGQMDLCAYNWYADTFAKHRTATGYPTLSVNWSMWQEDVWLDRQKEIPPQMREQLRHVQKQYGIAATEGIHALERMLASGLPQIIVSKQNFQTASQDWQSIHTSPVIINSGAGETHEEVSHSAPRNETEEKIAAIWQTLFGISDIGVHRSFFDLGGNSLHAIQLVARLRHQFHGDIPMDIIFHHPTVAELAEAVSRSQTKQKQWDEVERLLNEIEFMSEDELLHALSRDG
jgi:phthiocerol/phenolphthiocerol synthesis type-I polyketide synthase E